ncbi:MAG: hypothetical protein COA77_10760 [Thaumarchaeota archaeon]|nr:MAG: hypothetical protein COA77_10760 [Nitrososphaerota archaeon]
MSMIHQNQNTENKQIKKDFFNHVVEQINSIGSEVNKALKSIKETNTRTSMLAITAKIEANRTGDVGRNFLVVSNSIDELSTKTDEVIDKMKNETIHEINNLATVIENKSVTINGNRLANLALTNIRLVDRSLFERTADIRWWATDDILIRSLYDDTIQRYTEAENRLTEILKAYTVYHDLILCDTEGHCKASAESKFGLNGRNFSNKSWFKNAMNTENGTEYGFRSVRHSKGIDDHTVVFSCKVHENGNPQGRVIGVLAAVFKWKEFAQRIINETALTEEEKTKTRVLLCDDSGYILADTQEKILEQFNFKEKEELFKKEKGFIVQTKHKQTQLISHALSPGFEGYKSTEWHSLIVQDLDMQSSDLDSNVSQDNNDSLDSIIKSVVHLSDETRKATDEINKINDQTQILSLNAAIEAARVGDEGRGFGVIAGIMGDLSQETAIVTDLMSSNTQGKINDLNDFLSTNSKQIKGDKLANLSLTNVDLVDRALYERTADVRWWATDQSMVKSLVLKTNESIDFLKSRLHTILQYYTVYEDLIVTDNDGLVIVNGSNRNQLGSNVLECDWFTNVKKTKSGQEYSFDLVKIHEDGKEEIKLVFSCKVHKDGDASREAIGVLAIVFKWEQFAKTIFDETPLNDSEMKNTSLFITDENGYFLAQVDKNDKRFTKEELRPLLKETKNFDTISKDESIWLSGHAASVGYEGFSTGWHALIVQPDVK